MAPLDDIVNSNVDDDGRPLTRVYITPRRDDALDLDNAGNGRGGYVSGDNGLSPALNSSGVPVQAPVLAPSSIVQAIQGSQPLNDLGSSIARLRDKLLGANGQERYQFWPEKMVRSGVAAAGDALSGKFDPRLEETYSDMEPEKSDTAIGRVLGLNKVNMSAHNAEAISRVMDMAGLAGGGALTERPGVGTLGSGPMRKAAMPTPMIDKYPDVVRALKRYPDWVATDPNIVASHGVKGAFTDSPEEAAQLLQEMIKKHVPDWQEKLAMGGFKDVHPNVIEGLTKKNIEPQTTVGGQTYGVSPKGILMSDTQQPGAAVAALKSQSPFYSALEHATGNAKQDTMAPDQWLGYLKNQPGVKGEEMQWTGLDRWLGEQKGKVSKQDVQAYLDEHKVDVKNITKGSESVEFPAYQLPGGENYREHLLTLPTKPPEIEKGTWTTAGDGGDRTNYRSSHWDEPNVLAHVRTNDRDVAGKPSLHIEEIQSDWHQQGRKQGYKSEAPDVAGLERKANVAHQNLTAKLREAQPYLSPQAYNRMADLLVDTVREGDTDSFHTKEEHELAKAYNEANDAYKDASKQEAHNRVPDAPFKTAWPELALKRMVRMAAEEGKDRISWTPGEAQAARYDLSKHFTELNVRRRGDGQYQINGKQDLDQTGFGHSLGDGIPEDKLADYVGKDLAERILKDNIKIGDSKPYSGLDLKVGGEGMKGFYDNMLPKMAEKLGKAYGVKIKQHQPPVPEIRELPARKYTVGPAKWTDEAMAKRMGEGFVGVTDDMGAHLGNYPDEEMAKEFITNMNNPKRNIDRFEVEAADGNYKYFKTRKDAEQWLDKNKPAPVWYFDIPPAMKDAALHKGFPLFAQGVPFPLVPVDHDPFKKKERK